MDWFFPNKVTPVEFPRVETHICQKEDLEELFLQYQIEELSDVKFRKIWDKAGGLLIRSRIYTILDSPSGDTRITQINRDSLQGREEVSEEDVLANLCYHKGDGSSLAYDLCLEYLVKSKLKFCNRESEITIKSSNCQSSFRKRYLREITSQRRPLLHRLPSLTKRVKLLRKQDLENIRLCEEVITESTSSPFDDISSSSSAGEYETEDSFRKHSRSRRKNRKAKVLYQNYRASRRLHLLALERRNKKIHRRKLGKTNLFWPSDCCSRKLQLRNNKSARTILEFSVKALFLFICVAVIMDAFQFNEDFEDSHFENNL